MSHCGHQAFLLMFLFWLKLSEISLPFLSAQIPSFSLWKHWTWGMPPALWWCEEREKSKESGVKGTLGEAPVLHPMAVEMVVQGLPACCWPSSGTGALGWQGRWHRQEREEREVSWRSWARGAILDFLGSKKPKFKGRLGSWGRSNAAWAQWIDPYSWLLLLASLHPVLIALGKSALTDS